DRQLLADVETFQRRAGQDNAGKTAAPPGDAGRHELTPHLALVHPELRGNGTDRVALLVETDHVGPQRGPVAPGPLQSRLRRSGVLQVIASVPAARLGREKSEVPERLFGSPGGEAGGSGGAGQRHPAQPEIPQDAGRRAVGPSGRTGGSAGSRNSSARSASTVNSPYGKQRNSTPATPATGDCRAGAVLTGLRPAPA